MTASELALVRLCAAIGGGTHEQVEDAIGAACAACNPVEAEEAILQCYLFTGFPAVIQAMAEWRRRAGPVAAREAHEEAETFVGRGERVCATVYGGQYSRLRENVRALHPDLERWMLSEGYGKVLGRPGLELRIRELCIIAVLTGRDAPRQLYSHLRGALNAGAGPEEVEGTLIVAASVVPAARSEAAWRTWHEVQQRRSL